MGIVKPRQTASLSEYVQPSFTPPALPIQSSPGVCRLLRPSWSAPRPMCVCLEVVCRCVLLVACLYLAERPRPLVLQLRIEHVAAAGVREVEA